MVNSPRLLRKKASSASLKLKRTVIYMPASSMMPTIVHLTGVSSGMRLRSVLHSPFYLLPLPYTSLDGVIYRRVV